MVKKSERKEDCNSSKARVTAIDGKKISVVVEQNEGCAACAAASICEKTSKNGKKLVVSQSDSENFEVGELVWLNVPQSKIYKALGLAFLYPLLLIALVCVSAAYVYPLSDITIALFSCIVVALYYFVLYRYRHKPFFNFSLYISKIYDINSQN